MSSAMQGFVPRTLERITCWADATDEDEQIPGLSDALSG